MASSDTTGFKSLTEQSGNSADSSSNSSWTDWVSDHFATTNKPESSTKQASKSIALTAGFKGAVGISSQVNEATFIKFYGPLFYGTLSALALKSDVTLLCVAKLSAGLQYARGVSEMQVSGVAVKCKLGGKEEIASKTGVIGIHNAVLLTRQDTSGVKAAIPAIQVQV